MTYLLNTLNHQISIIEYNKKHYIHAIINWNELYKQIKYTIQADNFYESIKVTPKYIQDDLYNILVPIKNPNITHIFTIKIKDSAEREYLDIQKLENSKEETFAETIYTSHYQMKKNIKLVIDNIKTDLKNEEDSEDENSEKTEGSNENIFNEQENKEVLEPSLEDIVTLLNEENSINEGINEENSNQEEIDEEALLQKKYNLFCDENIEYENSNFQEESEDEEEESEDEEEESEDEEEEGCIDIN